jgi:hypothetical protein
MVTRIAATLSLLTLLAMPALPASAASDPVGSVNNCLQCHFSRQAGFNDKHSFGAHSCATCHAGDPGAFTQEAAHAGLVAFPGDLANARDTCGQCHADTVADIVEGNLMHTGHGMVRVTRELVDGHAGPADSINLQSLGHTAADSMLRKLCASCHLGQPKTAHAHDVMFDRGGGCLACHVQEYPDNEHPMLTTQVSDARCFGCHSRSGRISLSYTGLAEMASPEDSGSGLRLPDGRFVSRVPADVHYAAGMSCVDCHKAGDLMGNHGDARNQRDAVEARCTDCHVRNAAVTGHGPDHDRLTCAACHSQWAPQCFGCHMEYEPGGEQWDHVERAVTAGRWTERRWDVRSGLPALGVNASGEVDVFVPGMIMTVNHPDFEAEKFVRVFGPLSPHTTGPARSCESCHRSSETLGLGAGTLGHETGGLVFRPAQPLLRDGLPADAWTNLDNSLGGRAPFTDQRPLNPDEMRRIFNADIGETDATRNR